MPDVLCGDDPMELLLHFPVCVCKKHTYTSTFKEEASKVKKNYELFTF